MILQTKVISARVQFSGPRQTTDLLGLKLMLKVTQLLYRKTSSSISKFTNLFSVEIAAVVFVELKDKKEKNCKAIIHLLTWN